MQLFRFTTLSSGHGGTPLDTIDCFRPASVAAPCSLSGLEVNGFELQSAPDENELENVGSPTGPHLYDFPSVNTSRRNRASGSHDNSSNGGMVGHNYEFPDHYHLATQYEVPVSSYEKPQPRARLHIYKNTLPPNTTLVIASGATQSPIVTMKSCSLCRKREKALFQLTERYIYTASKIIFFIWLY